jgi:hypothetical protein
MLCEAYDFVFIEDAKRKDQMTKFTFELSVATFLGVGFQI